MRIAREGWPWIGGAAVLAVLAWMWTGAWGMLVAGVIIVFLVNFFRDPERRAKGEGLLAPADGRVVRAERTRVDIFMNVFDVHVVRAPIAGRVRSMRYVPGRFGHAGREGASLSNERLEIVLATEDGEVHVHLVAGLVARRIVPYVAVGDRVERGMRIGIILFGSRVDCVFPDSWKAVVEAGARVHAGEHVIAVPDGADDPHA